MSSKKSLLPIRFFEDNLQEAYKCVHDPIYFAKNYIYVSDVRSSTGMSLFDPFPYQIDIINNFCNNRYVITMVGRQQGKTTCAAFYIFWKSIFNENFTTLIVANIELATKEIMERINFMYECIKEQYPWLIPTKVEDNVLTLKFDNGSRIICRATTKNSGRGLSPSLLYVDELAAVDENIGQEFWSAVQPTIATGGQCIITSTPGNDEDLFAQIWRGATDIYDEHGNLNNAGIGANGFKALKYTWTDDPRRDEKWAALNRRLQGEVKFLREYCCEFYSYEDTLINGLTLKNLKSNKELFQINNVRWYSEPKANCKYVVTLDPGMGHAEHCNNAAIQVLEVDTMTQIAEWKHNMTPIPSQIKILMEILLYIHCTMENNISQDGEPQIFWTLENNSVGNHALSVIEETGEHNFPGTFVHEVYRKGSNKIRKGLNTNHTNKIAACSKLKSLIESNRLHISSAALIHELKNFIGSEGSFNAKSGETDDLISALLLAIRVMQIMSSWDSDLLNNFGDSLSEDSNDEYSTAGPLPYSF